MRAVWANTAEKKTDHRYTVLAGLTDKTHTHRVCCLCAEFDPLEEEQPLARSAPSFPPRVPTTTMHPTNPSHHNPPCPEATQPQGKGPAFDFMDATIEAARARLERQHPPTSYEVVTLPGGARCVGVRAGHLNPIHAQAMAAELRAEARAWFCRLTVEGRAQRLSDAQQGLSGLHTGISRLARRVAARKGLTVVHHTLTPEEG